MKEGEKKEKGEESGSEYVVDKVMNHRATDSGVEFLVRWKKGDSAVVTWESPDEIGNSAAIAAYITTAHRKQEFPMKIPHERSLVIEVLGVKGRQDGDVVYAVREANGNIRAAPSSELRSLYPELLLRFLESNVHSASPKFSV